MKFQLNTIPSGIPTWFIARSHRFTTHNHWRFGALLADNAEEKHLALIRVSTHERSIHLSVRGPNPNNFFVLLRDGLELVLKKFPGLDIKRTIPCPGHNGKSCEYEFEYAYLEKAVENEPPVREIQCQATFLQVPVTELIFGMHWRIHGELIDRIDKLEERLVAEEEKTRKEIIDEMKELRQLIQRGFTSQFQREQSKIESYCPNVFILRPFNEPGWKRALAGQKMELQLYCQAPGTWHPTPTGGCYRIDDPPSWLKTTGPYLMKLVTVLKHVAPIAGPWMSSIPLKEYQDMVRNGIDTTLELMKLLPDIAEFNHFEESRHPEQASGASLRALRAFLKKQDIQEEWGGLERVLTPEGHYLWLCQHHAKEYSQ